jgi:hypothetical protein
MQLARPYLMLQFAALECSAQISLAQCQLARAAREVSAARVLVARFPALLAEARGASLHLCGLYAHTAGDFAAAAQQFAAAEPVRIAKRHGA